MGGRGLKFFKEEEGKKRVLNLKVFLFFLEKDEKDAVFFCFGFWGGRFFLRCSAGSPIGLRRPRVGHRRCGDAAEMDPGWVELSELQTVCETVELDFFWVICFETVELDFFLAGV